MKTVETVRGFRWVEHRNYVQSSTTSRLIGESSKVGEEKDALDNPGGSYLWVGEHHHLDRREVLRLVYLMLCWFIEGRIPMDSELAEPHSDLKESE